MDSARMLLISVFAIASGILAAAVSSHAGETILVQVPAVYDAGAPVPEVIKKECAVESLVGNQVFVQVAPRFPESLRTENPDPNIREKLLKLTVLSVQGAGGDRWSGGNSITVQAELSQHGKPITTTVATRHSRGSMLASVRATCGIMAQIATALGKDIAVWLAKSLNASAMSQPNPAAASAPGDEKLFVQVPAAYDPGAPVTDAVKRECGIESLVGNRVFEAIRERYPEAAATPNPPQDSKNKFLQLTVLAAEGGGGGGWTGQKLITVRAELLQNGRTVGVTAVRRSSSGIGGLYSGTCGLMDRAATAVAKDIAAWLPKVTKGGKVASATTDAQPDSPKETNERPAGASER
jgi:hypothetical protein